MRARYAILMLALLACLPARAARVIAVTVDGVVHPVTLEIISHAIEQARREEAALVLVRLNTPGGLMDASRQIIERMVASPVPIVTYVTPSGGRAASAGFFLLQAGDVAAMAPGTNTGAASPVMLIGGQMDAVMRRKIENDAAASIRSLVSKRGRNAELAEKTVLEARSFTDGEALANRLIELVARDERELFERLDGREIVRFDGTKTVLKLTGASLADYKPGVRESIMSSLADPNIAFILLILGALGLYIEFTHPGLIAPGVAGAIMVLVGLSALSVLPINFSGVALLILALVLFVLEAKFASHGILGGGGAVAMVLGALLLVEGPPELRIRLGTAVAVTLPFAAITMFLLTLVLRARANKVMTGTAGMLGACGVALTPLQPAGKVFVRGEYWDAEAAREVPEGAGVRVIGVEGLKLKVEPTKQE